MGVFQKKTKSHLDCNMFFDEPVDIARYDQVKYSQIDKMTEKMNSFFWVPDEVDISKDKIDFNRLTDHEKHIFTSNLKRQILLDSVQGRSPNIAFLPYVSLPELETAIETWAYFETIHSRSYTHIIRNIYPNPSVVFDEMLDIQEIVDCAQDVSKYYDEFINYAVKKDVIGYNTNMRELKKKLWLCLNSVNILEGVRFYVSFACSWAFAELKKMEGNAKIIKFIARDENMHLALTQTILRNLPKEDPEFEEIKRECEAEVIGMFKSAIEQEKEWAQYLFKDGSMIGLNDKLLSDYIEWIGTRRIRSLGYHSPYQVSQSNPLPWTEKWIGGANVQVAPQETQISSYTIGAISQDVSADTLKGLSL